MGEWLPPQRRQEKRAGGAHFANDLGVLGLVADEEVAPERGDESRERHEANGRLGEAAGKRHAAGDCKGLQSPLRTGPSKEEKLDVQSNRGGSTDSQQRGRRVPEGDRRAPFVRVAAVGALGQARGDGRRRARRENVEETQAASEGPDGGADPLVRVGARRRLTQQSKIRNPRSWR